MKPKIETIQTRAATFGQVRDADNGVVSVTLSSETPVRRSFGNEILVHSRTAVNLERASDERGLPLTFNHDDNVPLGRVRNVRIEGGELMGDAHFDLEDPEGARRFGQVERGVLPDTSIRYSIDEEPEFSRDSEDVFIRSWTLLEATVATVPADPTVGIRKLETEEMDNDTDTRKAREEGARAERKRIADLEDMFRPHMHLGRAVEDALAAARKDGTDTAEAGRQLLEIIGKSGRDEAPSVPGSETRAEDRSRVELKADANDRFIDGATVAVLARAFPQALDEKELATIGQSEFRSDTMMELCKHSLRINGISYRGLDAEQIFKRAIDPGGPAVGTTTVFADLTENILQKIAFTSYAEAPRTWSQWCARGSATSFREYTRPQLSHADDLAVITENGEYQDATLVDKTEKGTLVKAGRVYSYTWEASLADDTAQLVSTGQRMAEAANRYLDQLPYTSLESGTGNNGPTMNEDSGQLFRAGNIGTPAAPSVASIEEAATLMRTQVDPNGVKLGIEPRYIIAPIELQFTVSKLLEAEYDPNATAGTLTPNSVRGLGLTPVFTHRLTSTTAWYLATSMGGTYEMTLLNGADAPALERETGWRYDAIHWKVRQQGHAFPRDFRGMVKNAGA